MRGVRSQFGYNGDGVRLRLVAAGTLTTYTQDYAAPLPVVLQAKTGAAATQYVYSLGTRPLSEYEATAWQYLLPDPLGSVRQIANNSGNVTLLKSYEPYGSVLNSQGSAASIFGYSGEQIDSTGLIYLRARYMQPGSGIFLSRDAWEGEVLRPGSLHSWSYAENDPIGQTDPTGFCIDRPGIRLFIDGNWRNIRVCEVEPGEWLWDIARNNGVDPYALIAFNPQFSNPNLIHAGDIVRFPPSLWNTAPSGNRTYAPPQGFISPGGIIDGFVSGVYWEVGLPYEGAVVHPAQGDPYVCPIKKAGRGSETVTKLVPESDGTYLAADYTYDFVTYTDLGASSGGGGSGTYVGLTNGFSRGFNFENYTSFSTCFFAPITGVSATLIASVGRQVALCGPADYVPNEWPHAKGFNDGIWTATIGVNLFFGLFSIDTVGQTLAYYKLQQVRTASAAELNNADWNIRQYIESP